MFDSLKSMVTEGKDNVVALAVKKFANYTLKEKKQNYTVEELHIDSKRKNISVTFTYPGGEKPLKIDLFDYKITTQNDHHFLEVNELVKSHDWGNTYIDGKRYKIPPEIVKAAEFIL